MSALRERLGQPIDAASLAVFRIAFGILIVVELLNDIANGDFAEYTAKTVHFSYPFFGWLEPWPPLGMAIHWAIAIGLALAVAAGAWLRWTAPLLFVVWTAIFLMERSEYVNHTYLYCWVTFWVAVLPIGNALSIDAWRKPERATSVAPAWARGVLVFQLAVVYFFAGVAKLDADWLAGVPMRIWLPTRDTWNVIRPLVMHDIAPLAIAWGGLAFDLGIVPALLWRRTRAIAFAIAIVFHLTNVTIFGLGSFPWFSIAATSLFLDPSWPRRFGPLRRRLPERPEHARPFRVSTAMVVALTAVAVLHLALPLRHWLYPGDVKWTEEGHPFSWRMMLRAKSGSVRFLVHDPDTGRTENIRPRALLTRHQRHLLPGQPDMILELAHVLAADARARGIARPKVFADGLLSLNGRPAKPLVDPSVDLAAERWTLAPWPWLEPGP